MEENDLNKYGEYYFIRRMLRIIKALVGVVVLLLLGTLFFTYQLFSIQLAQDAAQEKQAVQQTFLAEKAESQEAVPVAMEELQIVNGKEVQTGLLAGEGLQIVKATCTACHSSKLIIQSRMTREAWHEKIIWMQETQGLWDLGIHEDAILDYLAKNYGPQARRGRRAPLEHIQWYELQD